MGRFVVLGILMGLLSTGGAVRAEELAGRLFLGEDLHLYLERDESVLVGLLRRVSLVSGPAPVIDLTALAARPDDLFIGRDGGLYGRLADGGHARLGSTGDPSRIPVVPGTRILKLADALAHFSGLEPRWHLAVETPAPRVDRVPPPAGFLHWLDELDAGTTRSREDDDPGAFPQHLLEVVAGSLPVDATAGQERIERFRELEAFLAKGRPGNPSVFVALLRRVQQDIRSRALTAGANRQDARDLLDRYAALLDRLRR